MSNAQTEARAIQRYIAPSAGRGAVVQLLKHCDGEWVRYEDHAAALAAKDAELEKVKAECDKWREAFGEMHRQTMRAEASLAEKNKALEPFARNVELIHLGAQDHDRLCDYGSQFNGTPTVGQARAARRAREAHGGER